MTMLQGKALKHPSTLSAPGSILAPCIPLSNGLLEKWRGVGGGGGGQNICARQTGLMENSSGVNAKKNYSDLNNAKKKFLQTRRSVLV